MQRVVGAVSSLQNMHSPLTGASAGSFPKVRLQTGHLLLSVSESVTTSLVTVHSLPHPRHGCCRCRNLESSVWTGLLTGAVVGAVCADPSLADGAGLTLNSIMCRLTHLRHVIVPCATPPYAAHILQCLRLHTLQALSSSGVETFSKHCSQNCRLSPVVASVVTCGVNVGTAKIAGPG